MGGRFFPESLDGFIGICNNWVKLSEGGPMAKFPDERGQGWIEWILIFILAIMVLITSYLLLKPALSIMVRNFFQSLQ